MHPAALGGMLAMRLGEYDRAIRHFREALARLRRIGWRLDRPWHLVLALSRANRLDEARDVALDAVREYPGSANPLAVLAWVEEKNGNVSAAFARLLEALTIDPAAESAHREIVRLLRTYGGAAFRQVAAASPGQAEPHLRLAECLAAPGDPAAAEAHLYEQPRGDTDRHPRILERWAVLSLTHWGPKRGLERLDRLEPSPRLTDLRWLFERLAAGEPIRINCDGEDYEGPAGEPWGRDRFFVGGRPTRPFFRDHYFKDEVRGTELDELYRTERRFPASELPGGYRIPVVPGKYRISLHFAVIHNSGIGNYSLDLPGVERQLVGPASFDIRIEGETVRENYVPLDAGYATADVLSFEANVTDGILEITFLPRVWDPAVSAIEVVKLE